MIYNRNVLNAVLILSFCLLNHAFANIDFKLNFEEGDVPSLHPHILQGHARGRVLALLLYEGLTGVDQEGNPFLKNAKKVSLSDDQLLYTFELHRRQWSNGTPLTAYDYERSWKLAADPDAKSGYSDLIYVIKNAKNAQKGLLPTELVGVKALNDDTLQVELEYPAPYFLKLVAQPLFLPLSEDEFTLNGPFKIFHHEKNVSLVLRKNENFWNKSAIFLPQISISFLTDADTVLKKYQDGELDFIGEPISRLSNEALQFIKERVNFNKLIHPDFFGCF